MTASRGKAGPDEQRRKPPQQLSRDPLWLKLHDLAAVALKIKGPLEVLSQLPRDELNELGEGSIHLESRWWADGSVMKKFGVFVRLENLRRIPLNPVAHTVGRPQPLTILSCNRREYARPPERHLRER